MFQFCPNCGHPFEDTEASNPQVQFCHRCKKKAYHNLIPVAVGVAHVEGGGVAVVRRSSKLRDGQGKVALPGGNALVGETLKDCLIREFEEETGYYTLEDHWRVFDSRPTTDKTRELIFFRYGLLLPGNFAGNFDDEVTEVLVARTVPPDMAFPHHEEILRRELGY